MGKHEPMLDDYPGEQARKDQKQNWLDDAALKFRAADQYAALLGGKSQAVAKLAEPRLVLGKLPATAPETAQASRDALIADAEHKNRVDAVAAAAAERDEQDAIFTQLELALTKNAKSRLLSLKVSCANTAHPGYFLGHAQGVDCAQG